MWKQWLFHPLETWQLQNERQTAAALQHLKSRYHTFRSLLEDNSRAVTLLTDLSTKLRNSIFDQNVQESIQELVGVTREMVEKLEHLGGGEGGRLAAMHEKLENNIDSLLAKTEHKKILDPVVPLHSITDDMRGMVGGKAAVLSGLMRNQQFRVPDGFVIPLSSCLFFLEQDNLNIRLHSLLQPFLRNNSPEIPDNIVEEVNEKIMATALPPEILSALSIIARPFLKESGGPGLAVRSSAVSEDSQNLSFAGQYSTVLNVSTLAGVEKAFKKVVASSFSKRNLSYRLHAGLDPLNFDLAVFCLAMIDAKAAGTLFTRDPNSPSSNQMLVSAVHGLGELAVDGSIIPDIYRPDRSSGQDPSPSISRKERRMVLNDNGGIAEETVAPDKQELPALQPSQLKTLCRWGLEIEKLQNSPQDIEWAIASDDEIFLLQARPFRMGRQIRTRNENSFKGRKLLLSGGVIASSGTGTGKTWLIRNRKDLNLPPEEPYVIIMHQSLVEAVSVLGRARGILVDLGNPVDHLSCVAREYGIPMLTGLGRGIADLAQVEWVTVDADGGNVWQPLQDDIEDALAQAASTPEREIMGSLPTDPVITGLHRLIVPLNLTDAYGPTFSIAECRTIHDLIRYIHEKAVIRMFEAGDETLERSAGAVRHLESETPFMISIIDLGGGLVHHSVSGKWIKPEEIVSFPLKALWQGIADPDVKWGPPSGGAAMGSVMSRFLTDHKSARPVGLPNYALITRDYLNLNARMDFHFIMIDSVCGLDSRNNYIRFRFKGGGTSEIQRRRRVQAIAEILGDTGFACDVRSDLITADLKGAPRQVIEDKLVVLGRLLGFTRLLDAAMRSDTTPKLAAEAFLAGNYEMSTELFSAADIKPDENASR
jgi:pyruvate,water dikinase